MPDMVHKNWYHRVDHLILRLALKRPADVTQDASDTCVWPTSRYSKLFIPFSSASPSSVSNVSCASRILSFVRLRRCANPAPVTAVPLISNQPDSENFDLSRLRQVVPSNSARRAKSASMSSSSKRRTSNGSSKLLISSLPSHGRSQVGPSP